MTRRRRSACVETVKTRRPLMCPSTRPISAMCACHRSKLTIVDAFAQNRVHFFIFFARAHFLRAIHAGLVVSPGVRIFHLPPLPPFILSNYPSIALTRNDLLPLVHAHPRPPMYRSLLRGENHSHTHTPIVLYALYSLRLPARPIQPVMASSVPCRAAPAFRRAVSTASIRSEPSAPVASPKRNRSCCRRAHRAYRVRWSQLPSLVSHSIRIRPRQRRRRRGQH